MAKSDTPVDPKYLREKLALNAAETAWLLGVTPAVVQRLHEIRQLVGFKVGRALRWSVQDINEFIAAARKRKDGLQ